MNLEFLKRVVGNVAALLIGLAVACLVLEGTARILAGSLNLTPYMQYDDLLGWTARPNATKVHRDSVHGFEVTYRINADGLRGPQKEKDKRSGIRRIVLLGDSNGFGWGIPEGEHFAPLLEALLPDTEVFNLSLSGYGTDQQLLRFKREGLTLEPSVVILQVSPNDFEEIQFSFFNQKPKPRYILSPNGELMLTNVPPRAEGPRAEEFYGDSLPLPFGEWLGWHSFAYNVVNAQYFALKRRYWPAPRRVEDSLPYSPSSVRLFNRIVAELETLLLQIGARGVIVHASPDLNRDREALDTAFTVVDMYPVFMESRRRGAEPWFSDGYHWNAHGHRLVADRVASMLRQSQK